MIAARLATALGDNVALVAAAAGESVEPVIESVRVAATTGRASILLAIGPDVVALDRALLRAAVGPLAIELAPGIRLNALDIGPDASVDDIVAAAVFVAGATSTTGQLLDVT